MPPVKALLLESVHPLAERLLAEAGVDVETRSGALSEDELIESIAGVDLVGIRSKTEITDRVLDHAPDLKAIGAFCIGTNQIDLASAASRGIPAFNAPFSNTRSVVELAIAEIILMARRLTEKDRSLHEGVWDKNAKGSHEIRGRKLGIVGYGNIGSQLSVVAEMLGLQVYFYDTDDKLSLGNATRCSSLNELLEVAEVITLHVDGRDGNAGFFGAEQFARMRRRSLFLNLSRGFVVDYQALRENLLSGHIAGAAVDVFPDEPKRRGDAFASPLQGIPNVVLTPHIGGSTEEAQEDIGRFVAGKLRDYVLHGTTTLNVNMPSLNLPSRGGERRLIHFHVNTPGVLAKVNSVMAQHEVNIDGQMLNTRAQTGYVVTDVSTGLSDGVLDELRAMPETIRLRVIDG
ncbi:phosphoglycerate dehydrogenase [Demetria terragena]|uniref:phosphoglycerate dehydrogenase n=1 Tax=Demetria terragena TaxID=63959 RepID=UPI000361067F|nr:phosphoglycerate dehydrogenase [Demetria terragena]